MIREEDITNFHVDLQKYVIPAAPAAEADGNVTTIANI